MTEDTWTTGPANATMTMIRLHLQITSHALDVGTEDEFPTTVPGAHVDVPCEERSDSLDGFYPRTYTSTVKVLCTVQNGVYLPCAIDLPSCERTSGMEQKHAGNPVYAKLC